MSDGTSKAELAAWLRADPANADRFAFEAMIHVGCRSYFRGHAKSAPTHFSRRRRMAVAAGLVLCVTAATIWVRTSAPTAVVSGVLDSNELAVGAPAVGRHRLRQGTVRIAFASGASAIIAGPAEFAVQADRLLLAYGDTVVTCPNERSRAIRVKAGDGEIVAGHSGGCAAYGNTARTSRSRVFPPDASAPCHLRHNLAR